MKGFIEVIINNAQKTNDQNRMLISTDTISSVAPSESGLQSYISSDARQQTYNVMHSYDWIKKLILEATATEGAKP